jgi:glucokinase
MHQMTHSRSGFASAATSGQAGDVTSCLAVDIGGTKMAAAIVDDNGSVLTRAHLPTPRTGDAEVVFASVDAVVATVLKATVDTPVVCGAGCGGPMVAGGEAVSPLHIAAWRNFPLRRRLEELSALPVFVDNDAKAIALAEGWLGAARGHSAYVGMVVSTGVGGGIVLDGRLLDGRTGNAGHIGHVVVVPGGQQCRCGGRGCLEAEVSGTAIAAITGRPAEQATREIVLRSGTLVGRAVASVANLLDLPLAVVGGSVALGFGEPFFAAAQAEIDALARLSFSAGTRIVPALLGADAPLLGAAAVGWRGVGGVPGVIA